MLSAKCIGCTFEVILGVHCTLKIQSYAGGTRCGSIGMRLDSLHTDRRKSSPSMHSRIRSPNFVAFARRIVWQIPSDARCQVAVTPRASTAVQHRRQQVPGKELGIQVPLLPATSLRGRDSLSQFARRASAMCAVARHYTGCRVKNGPDTWRCVYLAKKGRKKLNLVILVGDITR